MADTAADTAAAPSDHHNVAQLNTTADETPESPTKTSKEKAYDGAYAAWLAEHRARNLHFKTRYGIATSTMYDPKLPQVTLSHKAFLTETSKAPTVDTTVTNPLFTSGYDRSRPTFHGCPSSLTEDAFFNRVKDELRSLSLRPSAKTVMSSPEAQAATKGLPVRTTTMSVEEAIILSELLSDPHCNIEFLDFTAALDTLEEPQPQPSAERLAEVRKEVAAIYGETETDESAEKLQAEVERLKGEYTTYDEGLTFLAAKKLERLAIIVEAMVKNKSVTELRLAQNNFGAPDETHHEGKAFFQPLNRLSRFIDLNKTVRILDLSSNHAGPVGVGIVAKAMCKNIGVHTLDLSGNDLMLEAPEEEEDPEYVEDDPVFGELYQALEALSEMIKKNKFLRSLSLRNNYINPEGVAEDDDEDMGEDTAIMKFFEPFKKYHRLEVLDLSNNELGDTGVRLLCSVLKENQSIRHLDLSSNKIGPKGFGFLANLLKDSEYIDTLVLQSNEFAGKKTSKKSVKAAMAAAQQFALALQTNKTLNTLNLSGNHFGPDLCEVLLLTLHEAEELTDFIFENNELCATISGAGIDDRALRHIRKALTREGSRIASVNLSGNNLQDEGIKVLCTVDENAEEMSMRYGSKNQSGALQGVVTLNLSRNFIGNEGLLALSKHLVNSVTVSLDLSYNNISVVAPLARSLQQSQLSQVNLSHNDIGAAEGNEAFTAFIDAVSNSRSIQSIDVSHNNLDDRHAAAIMFMCRSATPPFETFHVHGNPRVSMPNALKILTTLANNAAIRSFRMTAPANVDDQSPLVKAIYETLKQNTVLCDVDVGLQMSVAEEPEIREVQRLLLLNGLGLPREDTNSA